MPARFKDGSDTEMEDNDEYEQVPSSSKGKGKATATSNKNKRRVSVLKEAEAASRSEASADSSDLTANDDFSEKRRRRQSAARPAAPAPVEEDGDGPSGSGGGPRTPKKTAVARANRLDAIEHTPLPAVSRDVMISNFEEWMKMATDNKINAANSWNFALIDYFHDMSLLRNAQDGSVNFQKASYTLDGCVKVWTSRVDSCKNDTGKLLSNLTNDTGGDDDEEGGEDDGEEGGRSQGKRKRTHRPENTLAKSVEQLQVKKLETECTPDPLFKKTSADFDEGGAGGMLMNHLSVDAQLQIVFDASESRLLDEEDAEIEDATVLLGELRAKFVDLEELDEYSIMPTLSDFKFSSNDKFLDLTFASGALPNRNTPDEPMDVNGDTDMAGAGEGPVEDFFTGGEAVANFDDGFSGGGGGGFDDDDDDGAGGGMDDFTANNATGPNHTGPLEPFDPRRGRNERTLIMSMTEDATEMLDYFDSTVMKNWAGPQHWKVRRAIRKDGDTTGNTTTRSRKDKAAFMIDFEAPSENTAKKLFVPGTNSALTLPGAKTSQGARKKGAKNVKAVKKNDYLLPNDMHFSSMQLLRLFMKPKFTVKMRRHNAGDPTRGEDDEIDEKFWAQAAADNAAGPHEDDVGGGLGPIPFASQFFHDDDDGDDLPGFDDGGVPPEGMTSNMDEEDLIAATQGTLKRVRPEHINYTKRAKRVDVRMLKENIWKGLGIVVPRAAEESEETPASVEPEPEPTDPTEAREFTSVISGLRSQYPKEKLDEISTSFCFICLLHLANERGLKIQVGEADAVNPWAGKGNMVVDDDEAGAEEEDLKRIGELTRLQVFRDPNARPAA
ncbi:hypothetical protein FRC10_010644 [Ceratobasidium sp. 414]|nr:hypothetical protein FRC10_010644 [Ceratobasidium sp. 414]